MTTDKPVTVAAVGLDHRHIYGQLEGMLKAGCACKGWWTEGEPYWIDGFVKRFPDVPRTDRIEDILNDQDIDLVLLANIPADRAAMAGSVVTGPHTRTSR